MSELNGRELDAEVAVNLFGWEWLERDNEEDEGTVPRKAIFPPLDCGWVRFNFHAPHWRPALATTDVFGDWDRCCGTEDRKRIGLPRFSTDISAAMEVEGRIEAAGLEGTYAEALGKITAAECANGKSETFALIHATPEQRCRAALQAVRTE